MTTKRPSKAELHRRLQRHLAPEQPAPALPDDIGKILATYEPRTVDVATWEHVKPFVLDVIARYEPESGTLAGTKLRVGALVAYTAWANGLGYELDRKVLLDCELVEAFIDVADLAPTTAASYRSRLRGIVGKVNPVGRGPVASVKISHRCVQPPYDRREVATIVRIARTQPNERTGRQLRACVGLGLGAGLDSVDLKALRGRNCHDLGEQGIRIDVPGNRARTVWVVAEYDDLVRAGIITVQPHQLVVGTKEKRRHVASKIYSRAVMLGDVPHLEQSRLRTTWIARLLTSRLPLPLIMQAAGLQSARTITDLVPLLDLGDVDDQALLRGGQR